jgi:hypothetical protein
MHAGCSEVSSSMETTEPPCDGAWPSERVDLFRRWLNEGVAE